MLVHGLEHVAVTDAGLHHGDAVLGHRAVQPEVAHHGRDERVLHQVPALLHRDGQHRHDLVAVHDPAAGVDREAPVGVAVVRDADVGADPHHVLSQRVQVGRADTVVDVEAVGVGADHGDAGAGIAERLGRDSGCRAVGAVEHHVQAVEAVRQRREQVHDVAVFGVGEPADAADIGAGGLQLGPGKGGLDALLDLVGELDTAAREDLDAVVGGGVVGCRDHHAEVGVDVGDQVGRSRSRQHARFEHVHAGGGQSCAHRGGEELA